METVNQGLTIGNASDPIRMIERRKRLLQSLERATGDRKVTLQAEIDAITENLDAIRAALAE